MNSEHWTVLHVFTGEETMAAEPFPVAEIDFAAPWGPSED